MLESAPNPIPNEFISTSGWRDGISEIQHSNLGSGGPDPSESLAQVDRIIKSSHFYSSETLCRLLEYLALHTLNSPDDHLKEYRIATEILGRGSDFDSRYDASVRVQIGRLRTKLAEYYGSTGAIDPVFIDIPKGHYTLSFERRAVAQESEVPQVEASTYPAKVETSAESATRSTEHNLPRNRRLMLLAMVGCTLLLAGGMLVGFLLHRRTPQVSTTQSTSNIPPQCRSSGAPFYGALKIHLLSSATQPSLAMQRPACATSTRRATHRTGSRITTLVSAK